MRIERWQEAIMSFVRCVQQDMEIGEAWANIGTLSYPLRFLHFIPEVIKSERRSQYEAEAVE